MFLTLYDSYIRIHASVSALACSCVYLFVFLSVCLSLSVCSPVGLSFCPHSWAGCLSVCFFILTFRVQRRTDITQTMSVGLQLQKT